MFVYIVRRLAGMMVVMLIVAAVVFVIARVVPGDPAAVMLGSSATPEDIAALRSRLGLDQPLLAQFILYLGQIARFDLGDSIFLNRPVVQALAERSELTGLLTLMSVGIAVLIGVPVGILSAAKRGRWIDQTALGIAMLAASVPSFWIGLTLIKYLAVDLTWFPVAGYGAPDASFGERLRHLVLPAIALGIPNSALILRFTRTSMLDVLGDDYVRTARAKGLPPMVVVLKHALRNAMIPILTVIGLTAAVMIAGAIVTETVFGLPGVGNLIVSAVLRRDYPVIQGALLVVSAIYVLINLSVDLLYAVVDPRVRY
ncbi:ABC transporter permease [Azospirillum rugosum]|uniref:Peptide/nickel transport system permease protein n=1 Tax=Azospirillum rugosum TaxID=416170 RepID=A0ABS4SV39_9PROT|nr:ABC transporter permease [Azospirillum rugosum]MBP2296432.1 peptide/nickel transport system permease protein [Azospirillum rugosum]MDQ0529953.1 peptide/nickel transport system permease protein [Azospirillum rugosum]